VLLGSITVEVHGPVGSNWPSPHGLLAREPKQGTSLPPNRCGFTGRFHPVGGEGWARCCPGGSQGGEEKGLGCWRDMRSLAEVGGGEVHGGRADDGNSMDGGSLGLEFGPERGSGGRGSL
jgi:hypothetical protein